MAMSPAESAASAADAAVACGKSAASAADAAVVCCDAVRAAGAAAAEARHDNHGAAAMEGSPALVRAVASDGGGCSAP